MNANMPSTATIAAVEKAGTRNSSSRSNGDLALVSMRTKAMNAMIPTANATSTGAADHPLIGPWITAYKKANTVSASAACPGQSGARPSGAEESVTKAALNAAEHRAITAQAPKTHWYERISVSTPASSGASSAPTEIATAQAASPRARWRGSGVAAAITASEDWNSAAA